MTRNTDNIPTTSDLTRKIEYLRGFALEKRYEVLLRALEDRTRYVTVCAENTFHPQNASALVRSCEAFGVQEMHTVETLCKFSPSVRIVRGTDKWIDIRKHPDTSSLIGSLRKRGYRIIATSPHEGDFTPETFDVASGPFALFFGTEHEGISREVEEQADGFIRIPMYGMVESLNVSASAAILLYTLVTRLRAESVEYGLSQGEKDEILFKWLRNSVRDADNILRRGEF